MSTPSSPDIAAVAPLRQRTVDVAPSKQAIKQDIQLYKEYKEERTGRVDPHQKTAGAWWTAAAFIAFSHVLVLWMIYAGRTAAWSIVAMSIFQAWLQLLGITAGAHRLWSHRAFKATLSLRIFLAVIQLQSFQGSAYWWAMRHRIHHRFTDTPDDPYDATRGLWYSHIGWLFEKPPKFSKWQLIGSHDLNIDPVIVYQRKFLLLGYIIFGVLYQALLGWLLADDIVGGILWIGFVARLISWHGIFSINSFSHWWGPREYSVNASAVHSWYMAFMQNGEGHHSYHHEFPRDFRHGRTVWDWDPTKWCIMLWAWMGLASELVETPEAEAQAMKAHVLRERAREIEEREGITERAVNLPTMTRAEFQSECKARAMPWMIIHNLVIDVTTFEAHPGGQAILRAYWGKDATKAFTATVNQHTEAATFLAKKFAIAVIKEDDKK